MAGPDLDAQIKQLDATLHSIEQVLDLDGLRTEIGMLQEQVSVPDLWDDQANAQRVTGRLAALQGEVDRVTGLRARLDDLAVLAQLADEEHDAQAMAEAEAEIVRVAKLVDSLEIRTLLAGEYDMRDALISMCMSASSNMMCWWAAIGVPCSVPLRTRSSRYS